MPASPRRSVPLLLDLRGLPDAVAENKGCYPGQEIIEKIAAIGSPAKRLVLVNLHGPVSESRTLTDEAGTALGEITSVSPHGDTALAIVRKTLAREGASARLGGLTATVIRVAPSSRQPAGGEG